MVTLEPRTTRHSAPAAFAKQRYFQREHQLATDDTPTRASQVPSQGVDPYAVLVTEGEMVGIGADGADLPVRPSACADGAEGRGGVKQKWVNVQTEELEEEEGLLRPLCCRCCHPVCRRI